MKKIVQLIPNTTEAFAFYGEPNTIGSPVKVRFFALYNDGSISAFVFTAEGNMAPAESLDKFLYLA